MLEQTCVRRCGSDAIDSVAASVLTAMDVNPDTLRTEARVGATDS